MNDITYSQKNKLKITLIGFIILSINHLIAQIPSAIAHQYESTRDTSISDEFNANRPSNSVNLNKWNYRETKESGASTRYVTEENGHLICRGIKADKKAGGIVSKQYKKYGFYVTRWRTTGIDPNERSAWHPSIWSGRVNGQIRPSARELAPIIDEGYGRGWLEIDFVEFENFSSNSTHWSADAPARLFVPSINKTVKVNDADGRALGFKKAVMVEKVDSGFSDWQVWGLEYHPDYIQMWKKTGNRWDKKGEIVHFVNNINDATKTTIPKAARQEMFWYLGNLYLPQGRTPIREDQITNSTLQVDWFRFYPYTEDSTTLGLDQDITITNENRSTLSQNSPNPASKQTKTVINYSLAKKGTVHLLIYDLNGRVISTPVNEKKQAGNYNVTLNTSHLNSNMYIYKLLLNNQVVDSKKLVIK